MRRSACLAAILWLLAAYPAQSQSGLRAVVYAIGFSTPVAIVQDPTNASVQFVVEQGGRIRAVRSGQVLPTDFLDLRSAISAGGERGLLGLAFAPDYASSGRFFVNFTNPAGHTVIARFTRSADPLVADRCVALRSCSSAARRFIFQPYANHNGGNLAFGPDGYLYIGLGDGGSGNDPEHRAQNPAELLGKMLRIDVNVPRRRSDRLPRSRRTIRSYRAGRPAPCRRSGRSACGIRGGTRSTIPRAAAPAR